MSTPEKCPHVTTMGHEWESWCLDCGERWPTNLHAKETFVPTPAPPAGETPRTCPCGDDYSPTCPCHVDAPATPPAQDSERRCACGLENVNGHDGMGEDCRIKHLTQPATPPPTAQGWTPETLKATFEGWFLAAQNFYPITRTPEHTEYRDWHTEMAYRAWMECARRLGALPVPPEEKPR